MTNFNPIIDPMLPIAYNGCTCVCHRQPGVYHCVPCCHPTSVPELGFGTVKWSDANKDSVKIGRLEKKIRKLTQQRDHFKEQNEDYKRMIELSPFIETRFEQYKQREADSKELRELRLRVKEQSALIARLQRELEEKK